MAFHEAAISLSQEELVNRDLYKALNFESWALIAIRYGLRIVGLFFEIYKMASRDLTYVKMVLPSLERRGDVAASEDLIEPLEKLDSDLATPLMKAIATLGASNATKRAGRGGAAHDK